ncbi:hypothetical protein BUALT_Bualt09G0025900 [Buddleja alternifolia]|uniref:BUD13 homolog n=1 Tax=Buddleja alternifolia TaxID=168488 RepID=A0AAV6WYM2_9LAMI|nr:hypothetical protein BUALT_Bualt09G0025900 [Buddleja alternifolia]
MVGTSSAPASLKEYLKKYTNNDDEEKKKKKKKRKVKPDAAGVLVVDEDPIWQKPVKLDEDEEDSADEEKPQVDEDIEVKHMRRLEQLRLRRPFGAISEDGSGWISVSNTPNEIIGSEDQNADISPPRKRRARNDTPSPKQLEIPVDADLSPPRQRHNHHRGTSRYDTPSPEPYREALESDKIVTDLSPPRRKRRDQPAPVPEPRTLSSHPKATSSDISPRRGHHGSKFQDDSRTSSAGDLSPPRKVKNDRFSSIASSRKSSHLDDHDNADAVPSIADLSPPRKRRKESSLLVHRPKTGLVSGKDVKDEIDKTKKEDWLSLGAFINIVKYAKSLLVLCLTVKKFNEMDPSVSGRNAEPIYRHKITGERMSKEEFLKSQKKELKKEEKPKEIKLEWGKGLAQKREAEARLQEIEAEKEKPFARSRDDADLDSMLKERVRWGDPMAHLNKQLEPVLRDLGNNEKMKESGFVVPQEIPSHSWIKRRLPFEENRYGIKPGRHWDGVDRSTGYEKGLFKRKNEKGATDKEAYAWSVADM